MLTSDERERILKLLEAGQISADEAAQLLDALAGDARAPGRVQSRLVRIRVSDLHTGRLKANVTVPVGLVNVGLRLGARLAPQFHGSALEDLLQTMQRCGPGRLLEWQDLEEGERVELLVE